MASPPPMLVSAWTVLVDITWDTGTMEHTAAGCAVMDAVEVAIVTAVAAVEVVGDAAGIEAALP